MNDMERIGPACKQCGHIIQEERKLEMVTFENGAVLWLHAGGCEPGSYEPWMPTRKIEQ